MREIGGYFGCEFAPGSEYYPELIPLNSGRNALWYVLEARKINRLYVPYYLCDSISMMCENKGFNFVYYHIGEDFLPSFSGSLRPDEYILIVNYFGTLSDNIIRKLREQYINIILDNTQAFFVRPVSNVDTIYSCRKFFGVSDGAYLSTSIRLQRKLKRDMSRDRLRHIFGRFEENAGSYYSCFRENESLIDDLELRAMSAVTHNMLRAIDYNKVINTRNANAALLALRFREVNRLDNLQLSEAPFAYPLYIEKGAAVRKRLACEGIYIPTLWPNVLYSGANIMEKDYAENILPLPCDQRYTSEDMEYLSDRILMVMKNLSN